MELPFLVAQLALYSADGLNNVDLPHPHPQSQSHGQNTAHSRNRSGDGQLDQQMLYGSLVASPQFLRNYQGKQGVYFLFPDVSIRWKGQYRLGVSLLKIPGQVYYFASLISNNIRKRLKLVYFSFAFGYGLGWRPWPSRNPPLRPQQHQVTDKGAREISSRELRRTRSTSSRGVNTLHPVRIRLPGVSADPIQTILSTRICHICFIP